MLVLTRKEGETITVDGPCTIKVVRTGSGHIKLGFDCPKTTQVLRGNAVRRDKPDQKQAKWAKW